MLSTVRLQKKILRQSSSVQRSSPAEVLSTALGKAFNKALWRWTPLHAWNLLSNKQSENLQQICRSCCKDMIHRKELAEVLVRIMNYEGKSILGKVREPKYTWRSAGLLYIQSPPEAFPKCEQQNDAPTSKRPSMPLKTTLIPSWSPSNKVPTNDEHRRTRASAF